MYDTSDADGYVVYYNGTAKLVVGDMKETTLDGLIPGANYSITVRAYQDILGPSNTTLYSTTNEGIGNNIIVQCAFLNEPPYAFVVMGGVVCTMLVHSKIL